MNRIGENYQNIEKIKEIFAIKNIEILGLFTHLSVSDSSNLEDINFTKRQINNFFQVVNGLKSIGYSNFSSHIQSSYGILNYPELNLDYVRIGIIMSGAHSQKNIKTIAAVADYDFSPDSYPFFVDAISSWKSNHQLPRRNSDG